MVNFSCKILFSLTLWFQKLFSSLVFYPSFWDNMLMQKYSICGCKVFFLNFDVITPPSRQKDLEMNILSDSNTLSRTSLFFFLITGSQSFICICKIHQYLKKYFWLQFICISNINLNSHNVIYCLHFSNSFYPKSYWECYRTYCILSFSLFNKLEIF